MRTVLLLLTLFSCVFGVAAPARAQTEPSPPALESPPPRIALMTMGPGDAFVTKFGHDALVVQHAGGPALVYNFGMYRPETITPGRVLSGHLRYWLAVAGYDATVAYYRRENRRVFVQELALDPESAIALAVALGENARPENASYRYDYAFDNCTTRVRDALDRATSGALRRTLQGVSPLTYRDHALRFLARDPTLFFLFDLGLGPAADRPLPRWADAYLPDRLAAYVRTVELAGPTGRRPLVAAERVIFEAARRPPHDVPPRRAVWFALIGVLVGGGLLAASHPRRSRALRGASLASVCLPCGGLGLALLLLLITNVHPVAHGNANVLLCPPWALLLVPSGLALARGRVPRRAPIVALACLASALAGVVLHVVTGQEGHRIALLFVPIWAAVWFTLRRVTRSAAS